MKAECFHVVVIDYIDAQIQQVLAILLVRCNQRTDSQIQLVEYAFVHDTIAINQVLESINGAKERGSLMKAILEFFR